MLHTRGSETERKFLRAHFALSYMRFLDKFPLRNIPIPNSLELYRDDLFDPVSLHSVGTLQKGPLTYSPRPLLPLFRRHAEIGARKGRTRVVCV